MQKNAGISGTYILKMETDMMVLFAVFYSSIKTVFLQMEKLLYAKHFTLSTICSSAYIPPIVHILPDML
jgi:hypothetical protein